MRFTDRHDMTLVVKQSVKNAGVAFVKGAKFRNNNSKKTMLTMINDEQAKTKKPNDEQAQGRTDFGTNTVR